MSTKSLCRKLNKRGEKSLKREIIENVVQDQCFRSQPHRTLLPCHVYLPVYLRHVFSVEPWLMISLSSVFHERRKAIDLRPAQEQLACTAARAVASGIGAKIGVIGPKRRRRQVIHDRINGHHQPHTRVLFSASPCRVHVVL